MNHARYVADRGSRRKNSGILFLLSDSVCVCVCEIKATHLELKKKKLIIVILINHNFHSKIRLALCSKSVKG